jgi:ferredoxin--NADP+ reductase
VVRYIISNMGVDAWSLSIGSSKLRRQPYTGVLPASGFLAIRRTATNMGHCVMESEQIAQMRSEKYNATVHGLNKVHSDLMMIRIKPDKPIMSHKAGQYTLLGLGNWEPRLPGTMEEVMPDSERSKLVRRSYSISAAILDEKGNLGNNQTTPYLEFYIVLVRETSSGKAPALTPRLFMLKEGDRMFCGEKITGAYNLDLVKPDDTVLLLGTGTGEAPHNYMAQQLLLASHKGPIVSACCVRLKKDLGYLATHEKLMSQYRNYHYIPLATREPENAGKKVYIQDLLKSGEVERKIGRELDPSRTHVFLCGNPAMIGVPEKNRESGEYAYPVPEGVIEVLEKRGFRADRGHHDRGNIHFEEYWS